MPKANPNAVTEDAAARKTATTDLELPPEFEGMTLQEIQLAIAKADLQAKLLDLDRIKDDNARRLAVKEANEKFNRQIQEEIESQKRLIEYSQKVCRHRMGGRHQNVWAGDGKPCVARTQMLDGFTWLVQCIRCRLKVFTPHPSLQKENPEEYAKQKELFERMWALSSDSGMDEIRGPTFTFTKDGVPFIPARQ